MSTTVKTRILLRRDTTEAWNNFTGFIPLLGEPIIYLDRSKDDEGNNIPGIKIGDGKAFLVDLPFVTSDVEEELMRKFEQHLNDPQIHVSYEDRERWDSNNIEISIGESETLVIDK